MSCLFHSLGSLIGRNADEVRQDIVSFIETNPDLMGDGVDAAKVVEWESGQDLRTYVRSMRQRFTWGGALEITAFVHMTGWAVVVHDIRRRPPRTIDFVSSSSPPSRRRLRLHISWNGGHYEPLRMDHDAT